MADRMFMISAFVMIALCLCLLYAVRPLDLDRLSVKRRIIRYAEGRLAGYAGESPMRWAPGSVGSYHEDLRLRRLVSAYRGGRFRQALREQGFLNPYGRLPAYLIMEAGEVLYRCCLEDTGGAVSED